MDFGLSSRILRRSIFTAVVISWGEVFAAIAAGEDLTVTVVIAPQNNEHGDVFVVGHSAVGAFNVNPPPPAGVSASFTWSRCCPPSGPIPPPCTTQTNWNTNPVVFHHSRIGTVEYRCKVTYSVGRQGTGQATVDVKGPNRSKVMGLGQNSEGSPIMVRELRFRWAHKVDDDNIITIGSPVEGYVQERIIRGNTDSGWVPDPPNPNHPDYFFDPPDTVDRKAVYLSYWDTIPVGEVFDQIHQRNRVVIPDYCGAAHTITEVDGRILQKIKSGAETFKVEYVPDD